MTTYDELYDFIQTIQKVSGYVAVSSCARVCVNLMLCTVVLICDRLYLRSSFTQDYDQLSLL